MYNFIMMDGIQDSHPPPGGRREEILAVATRLFNRFSFAAVTLNAIAREIGVTTGALYHHFSSKEELVFECLSRGVALYRDELGRSVEPGMDGLEMVRRFIRGRLRPGEPRMIVFSEIDALPKAHRVVIHEGRLRNVHALSAMIETGIADGSIAVRDPYGTSLAIFSVLDWMPLWYSESSYYTRQEAADAIDDLLTHGVLARHIPEPPVLCPEWDAAGIIRSLLPKSRRQAKWDHLLRVASRSFNQLGVVGSSMEAIAEDAGVTRSALYYHAPDKMTLLRLCLERAYRNEGRLLDIIQAHAAGEADPVRRVIATEAYVLLGIATLDESDLGPKINFLNTAFLDAEQREQLSALHRAVVGTNRARYRNYIESGIFRKLDINFIQEIGAGMRNNLPTWHAVALERRVPTFADLCVRLFLFGIKPRKY